jgi:decaprenylphospho-beta-D-erythro-pentofuranosid-2-ulose 2-reductase
MKRFIIIGATSSIAEHCARLWIAQAAVDLTLVARNSKKVESIAADLMLRSPDSNVRVAIGDFENPESIQTLVNQALEQGEADCVLIAHGALPDQVVCQEDLATNARELFINGISPVLFAEAFANSMVQAGRGSLGIIGSVAGDRGRKSNYVYGAAKGLINRYAQGLQHRLAGTKVTVTLIKPGPTRTPMTEHLGNNGQKLAHVSAVASDIVKGMEKGHNLVYSPAKWRIIMAIIRHLPSFIFNRIEI